MIGSIEPELLARRCISWAAGIAAQERASRNRALSGASGAANYSGAIGRQVIGRELTNLIRSLTLRVLAKTAVVVALLWSVPLIGGKAGPTQQAVETIVFIRHGEKPEAVSDSLIAKV